MIVNGTKFFIDTASLHDGSVGGHVNVRTPEVLIIFQYDNNIINCVGYSIGIDILN